MSDMIPIVIQKIIDDSTAILNSLDGLSMDGSCPDWCEEKLLEASSYLSLFRYYLTSPDAQSTDQTDLSTNSLEISIKDEGTQ